MKAHEFYEILPDGRYRFRIDHHTLQDYNKCDRYFDFRHMPDPSGLVWGTRGISIKIAIGSWWSSVMEAFYREMTFGRMPSEHNMMCFANDAWLEHKMDDFKNTEPEVYDKFKGREGALLMALEYYQAFGHAHYSQWQVIGAELGFGWKDELLLGEDDRVVVYYGGKPDLTIYDRVQNMVMPPDFKTVDSIPSNVMLKYKPHPQTAGYIFAVSKLMSQVGPFNTFTPKPPTKCIVIVCARYRPTDKPRSGVRAPRFVPVYVNYSADEIEEWRLSVMEKCRRLRDSIERNYFPPRESACHLYYHGCAFRRVCAVPSNARAAVLKADFVKIEPWIPYDSEED